jgi:hypothetical protein
MAVSLFHLGDSPMHAEISNTLNPANTLTPCRMCDLHVSKQADKQSENFVRDFLGLDEDGEKVILAFIFKGILNTDSTLYIVSITRSRMGPDKTVD